MASPENKHCANCIDTVSFPVHRWTRHTHPFNGPLSGTTQDFTEARDSEWQWHQLGHMQVCTSLQADNHATQFFTGRMPFLPPNQCSWESMLSNGSFISHLT